VHNHNLKIFDIRHSPIVCIQCSDTPDDGQWTCPKHVEYLTH